jgi:hypothetical protein
MVILAVVMGQEADLAFAVFRSIVVCQHGFVYVV